MCRNQCDICQEKVRKALEEQERRERNQCDHCHGSNCDGNGCGCTDCCHLFVCFEKEEKVMLEIELQMRRNKRVCQPTVLDASLSTRDLIAYSHSIKNIIRALLE